MTRPKFIPLPDHRAYSEEEMRSRAADFRKDVGRRRSVRDFSPRPVAREVIEDCLLAAGSAPSGANMQPWRFVVISDAKTRRRIREGAEEEEREFYRQRAPREWLRALEPLGTDENKPFLEIAPYLIAIFAESYGVGPDGEKIKHYYAQESVGIACGILITALHNAGLACLTHTPSPMKFLNRILERPENERPFLLLVVGHPAEDARVPDIGRKPLDEISIFR